MSQKSFLNTDWLEAATANKFLRPTNDSKIKGDYTTVKICNSLKIYDEMIF